MHPFVLVQAVTHRHRNNEVDIDARLALNVKMISLALVAVVKRRYPFEGPFKEVKTSKYGGVVVQVETVVTIIVVRFVTVVVVVVVVVVVGIHVARLQICKGRLCH